MTKATKKKAANDNARPLTFVSMFSGIEAASVAFGPLGWSALAFAEIEKFPSAVLAHHYPDVPNVGDMTAHDWSRYRGKADIVCGGPPCQAFSVAGLRNSMDDARGNLSLAYMRAIHAIKPRNAITENVPGWLSTKDNAFGCFLAGLVGADDALPPPDGRRWPDAGMVSGPQGRAAWRILDAQFFGLAQRRRRVIVVADFGNGADPAAVLFERKGMSWNPAPSREEGEGVAPTISARTKGGGGLGTDFDLDGGLRVEKQWPAEIASTLDTTYGPKMGQDNQHVNAGCPLFVPAVAHAIQAGALRENPNSGPDGVGVQEGMAYTLEARAEVQAVCITGEITHALKAEGADASEDGTGRGNPIVAQTVAIRGREGGATAELGGEVATALRASGGGGDKSHVLTQDIKAFTTSEMANSFAWERDYAPTLTAHQSGDNSNLQTGVRIGTAVRRLTPVECERLQGFPDGYTNIPWRGKQESPDGPRYKALGNSWAVPKFRWIGERIARLMPADNDNQERQVGDAA